MTDEERLRALSLDYALGALEGDELEEIETLLAQNDPEAQSALAEAREVAAALALAAPETIPPATLREKLMAKVDPHAQASLTPPSRGWSAAAWAAAAAAAVCAALFWQQLRTTRDALRNLQARFDDFRGRQEEVAQQNIRYHRILDILAAPDTFAVQLDATSHARIHAYWNDRQGLVVAGRGIPQPEPGRELQFWVVPRSGAPESIEVFRPDQDGNALILAEPTTPIAEADALAITDEPAGGSPGPTTTPIWAGRP